MSKLQVNEINDTGGHSLLGRKNAIINGNFDVWQRGTSQTTSGYGSADRWGSYIGTTTQSVTQQTFTLGQTDVPNNPKYFYQNVVTTGSTSASYSQLSQRFEGVSTFAGETVTLSFYAKADSSKNIAIEFYQYFGSGGSPSSPVNAIEVTTVALTGSWAKYTVTADIPSISGKTLGTDGNDWFGLVIWLDAGSDWNARTNSLGNQSGTFDIAQVQLEKGSVATEFERRTYGEELALCQRYYEVGSEYGSVNAVGTFRDFYHYIVPKRALATISVSGTSGISNGGGTDTLYGFDLFGSGLSAEVGVNVDITADAEL
jgi:hypothetical protein